MTEEEKSAIEHLKIMKENKNIMAMNWNDGKILLNLIQKQDTEINKLNNVIDRMAEDIKKTNIDIVNEGYAMETMWLDKEKIKEYFMKENKDG